MNDDGYFDDTVALTYDQVHGGSDAGTVTEMVGVLADLADGGPALEFAIGTGRVALPLAARGVPVKGIELSAAMVAQLYAKDPQSQIEVIVGDMTKAQCDGAFSLVYLVYNTIDNLTSQAAQVACFQNAANHLAQNGCFVIETLVPPIQKIPFGSTLLANDFDDGHWGIDDFDIVTQTYTSHHARFDGDGATRLSIPFRYAWPAEMDLMAQMAGLSLVHRWSDWQKSSFDRSSKSHVSVWRKVAA